MKADDDLSHHILPNSATMVGVCIMVISIVKGMPADTVNYFIDKALAVDCVLFMVSALFSFISIRFSSTFVPIRFCTDLGKNSTDDKISSIEVDVFIFSINTSLLFKLSIVFIHWGIS